MQVDNIQSSYENAKKDLQAKHDSGKIDRVEMLRRLSKLTKQRDVALRAVRRVEEQQAAQNRLKQALNNISTSSVEDQLDGRS